MRNLKAVETGFYGMVIMGVHDSAMESLGRDQKYLANIRAALDNAPSNLIIMPVGDNEHCFYVVRKLARGGGVIAMMGAYAGRSDTPGEAYQAMAVAAPETDFPLAVMWLESIEMVKH
mgnify:CR=1 FL=1